MQIGYDASIESEAHDVINTAVVHTKGKELVHRIYKDQDSHVE